MMHRRLAWIGLAALAGVAAFGASRAARAAGVLLRFGGDVESALARYGTDAVIVEPRAIDRGGVHLENDVYRPRHAIRGRLVLVHGMHHLGHREPRLVALARSLAAAGIEVWTPRIETLASYRLDPRAVNDVSTAAAALASSSGRRAVPVMGISFAGGLALLAASDPRLSEPIAGVVALGAQHDLARVARWFAGDPARGPHGERTDVPPHPYGAELFLREDAPRFFGAADAPLARELLLLCLHDDWRAARSREGALSAPARGVLERAIAGLLDDATRGRLRALIGDSAERLAQLSPRDRLRAVRVPVLLLHGAEDPIVPATEAYYLAEELPDARVLVTRALRHAEGADDAPAAEKLALVRFMDAVLALAAGSA